MANNHQFCSIIDELGGSGIFVRFINNLAKLMIIGHSKTIKFEITARSWGTNEVVMKSLYVVDYTKNTKFEF